MQSRSDPKLTILFRVNAPMFTTEVWLTPLILLPGVALLTVSTSARFGQIQAEFHRMLDHPAGDAQIVAAKPRRLAPRCFAMRSSRST